MFPALLVVLSAAACLGADEWRSHYEKGLELFRGGRPIEAQQEFQAVLAASPAIEDPLVLFNLGTIALESGDGRTAVAYLEKAAALQPEDPVTLKALIAAHLSAGQAMPALQTADRVLALGPSDTNLLLETGEMLSAAGHVSHAVQFFHAAQKGQTGSSAFFTKLLTEADAQIRRDREKVDQLTQLVKAEPRNPTPVLMLGLQWIKLGQFERAYALLQPALVTFEKAPEILLGYALACYFTGRNDDAEKTYKELVKRSPASDQPYFALGNFYADTGRPEEAVVAFRKAAAKNPSNYLNPYMCGVSLFRTQAYAPAETSLRAALKLNPKHADSYYWLGKIGLLRGDQGKALQSFEMAVKLEPKHAGAYYQLALLYARMGDKQKSEEALQVQRQLNTQLRKGLVALRMP
jgi:tetratricopeptide (TPR) repeat protein